MLVLAVRIILGVVLGVAGFAKLQDRESSREAFRRLGVPPSSIDLVSRLLPLIEIALAIALIPSATAAWSAAGTAFLFGLFALIVLVNLVHGNKASCGCFGRIYSGSISWPTFGRNLLLTAAALFLAIQLPGRPPWIQAAVAFGAASSAIAFVFSRNLRREKQSRDLIRSRGIVFPTSGLPVGAPAPDFTLHNRDLQAFPLSQLLRGAKPFLLAFIGPDCPPCDDFVSGLEKWRQEHPEKLEVAVVYSGELGNTPSDWIRGIPYFADNAGAVQRSYQAHWAPGAVVVTSGGTIGSRLANGEHALKKVLSHAEAANKWKPWAGDSATEIQAPPISLPDLNGRVVSLSEFLGRKVLLIFWDAHCTFCIEFAEEIRAYERQAPPEAPQLLFIAGGSAELNRAFGLASPMLLDADSRIGDKYGAGTPSALLIDEEGRPASFVEAGSTAVLALLGFKQEKSLSAAGR